MIFKMRIEIFHSYHNKEKWMLPTGRLVYVNIIYFIGRCIMLFVCARARMCVCVCFTFSFIELETGRGNCKQRRLIIHDVLFYYYCVFFMTCKFRSGTFPSFIVQFLHPSFRVSIRRHSRENWCFKKWMFIKTL